MDFSSQNLHVTYTNTAKSTHSTPRRTPTRRSDVPPILAHILPNASVRQLERVTTIAGGDGSHHRRQESIGALQFGRSEVCPRWKRSASGLGSGPVPTTYKRPTGFGLEPLVSVRPAALPPWRGTRLGFLVQSQRCRATSMVKNATYAYARSRRRLR